MKIAEDVFVGIEYTLALNSGEVVDKSAPDEGLAFIYGKEQVIPGLEKELAGMEAGQSADFSVSPEDGYGEQRPELINEIPRSNFPEEMEIEPGMVFQANGPQGPTVLRVKELKDDAIVADFNHPLAGETLNFSVKIVEVREPTKEEIEMLDAPAHECHSCGEGCGGDHHH
jgi:FKBP-type peptidyl-prolyl cis-trans isomerase SlyD